MSHYKKKFKTVDISNHDNIILRFLYGSIVGRLILKITIHPVISKIGGAVLSCSFSRYFIPSFIVNNHIDMRRYRRENYRSFNQFFTRKLKGKQRRLANSLLMQAPCDGKLTAYAIKNDSCFAIKGSKYTLDSILKDQQTAQLYADGLCLIFRLMPDDYHRYSYIDDGLIRSHKKIKGVLHTVRPVAFENFDVYHENAREWTLIETKNFGKVVQIEVGALMVGKIKNKNVVSHVSKGEEKGFFEFGGSTIILLFQKDAVTIDNAIWKNTSLNKETVILHGDVIGSSKSR
ncbi:MAG TPA: phosphatidylserine decarboxylase [Epulopiscium sp.]|nr:phosphatidylserine decarboxylase [Candidatus Epulonipiscium sp.]